MSDDDMAGGSGSPRFTRWRPYPLAEGCLSAFPRSASERGTSIPLGERLGVQSRHLMDWIEGEPFGFSCPDFADELVRRETLEGLQPSAEIVG